MNESKPVGPPTPRNQPTRHLEHNVIIILRNTYLFRDKRPFLQFLCSNKSNMKKKMLFFFFYFE